MTETVFKSNTFSNETELLIRFGMRKFYHKIRLPRPLLSENLLSKLISTLISWIRNPANKDEFLSHIQQIIEASLPYPSFQQSLKSLSENQTPESAWELASDLANLYHEYINYLTTSFSLFEIQNDLSYQNQESMQFIQDLSSCKPQNSRDSQPISFDFSDPNIATLFNQFIEAQSNCVHRCTICGDPGTWFSYPCSHLSYCDTDYQEDLENDMLQTDCPSCAQTIDRYVHIDLAS